MKKVICLCVSLFLSLGVAYISATEFNLNNGEESVLLSQSVKYDKVGNIAAYVVDRNGNIDPYSGRTFTLLVDDRNYYYIDAIPPIVVTYSSIKGYKYQFYAYGNYWVFNV